MINGLILKKNFHPSFIPPIHLHSLFCLFPSLSFSRLSVCLSYVVPHLSKDAHGYRRTAKNKNAEGRIDGFIVEYHLQSVPDKFLIPLTHSKEFILSFFSFLLPAAIFHRRSHPSVMDSREKMKSRLWFIAKRSSLSVLSSEETYIANTRRE